MSRKLKIESLTKSPKVILTLLIAAFIVAVGYILKDSIARQFFVVRGNTAYVDREFGDSEVYYYQALEMKNTPSEIHFNLANAYYKQGRYREAIQKYNAVISANKSIDLKADAIANMGNALFMIGDTAQSLEAYKKALLLKEDEGARQNYLFVLDKLRRNKLEKPTSAQKKKQQSQDDKNDARSSAGDEQKGKPTNEESEQNHNVTEKEMEVLFDMINQSEKSVRGRVSKAKQKQKPLPTDEYDY